MNSRDRLIEDLLSVKSQLDDAYNMNPQDKEWIRYLVELQSTIYKALMHINEEEE